MLISRLHTTTGGGPHPPVILYRSRGTCHPGVGLSDALCPRSTAPLPSRHAAATCPAQWRIAQLSVSSLSSRVPMPPKSLGLRFSSASKWCSLRDSLNKCSTYSLDACTKCTSRHCPAPPPPQSAPTEPSEFLQGATQRARTFGFLCLLPDGLRDGLGSAGGACNVCKPAHPPVRNHHGWSHSVPWQQQGKHHLLSPAWPVGPPDRRHDRRLKAIHVSWGHIR